MSEQIVLSFEEAQTVMALNRGRQLLIPRPLANGMFILPADVANEPRFSYIADILLQLRTREMTDAQIAEEATAAAYGAALARGWAPVTLSN